MVRIPTAVGVAGSVYVLLMTVAILRLTYLSTKQDYAVETEEKTSAT